MAQPSNDDLAKALAGLAGGEHAAPEDAAQEEEIHSPPAAPPRAAPPPAARPPRPVVPVPRVVRAPAPPGAKPPPVRPQRAPEPARPAASPPAEESLTSQQIAAEHDQQAEAMTHVVEDDDAVNVPAAPMEYLAHSPPPAARKRKAILQAKSLEAQRTIIPMLLTAGVIFLIGGVLRFVAGEEAPFAILPLWMSIALFIVSAGCLVMGVFNMLQVRDRLARAKAAPQNSAGSAK